MKFIKNIYIGKRFFGIAIAIIVVFIAGNFVPIIFSIAKVILLLFILLVLIDIVLLWSKKTGIESERFLPERLSLGDENKIKIQIKTHYPFLIHFECIEELPPQFQKRDFKINGKITPENSKELNYGLKPKTRGEYHFGATIFYIKTKLGLVTRKYKNDNSCMRPVYPSFIQMRKYELLAISNRLEEVGVKKIRKLGHQLEFDHIRDYVIGDDPRSVNWKATARRGNIMINQFQDECSQRVYSLINMGRVMEMPFEGMTLLDYSINASLILSNIALHKSDKAGLMTFSQKVHTFLPASQRGGQMQKIMDLLYKQSTNFDETNLEKVYSTIHSKIKVRSLLLFFTNYEGLPSLKSQLPILRQIAKKHLLLVILFKNTEIDKLTESSPKETKDIYIQTIAKKYTFDKEMMIKELDKYGIHGLLTTPKGLSVNLINKYLEFKAKRLM